jgi:ubiquinone/menaquinone biosynthesis C-methylase UbiE
MDIAIFKQNLMGSRIPESEAMDSREEAETYDKLAKDYLFIAEELIARMALAIGPAQGRCLDLCSGPSRIPIKLAQQNPNLSIFALDYSQNMVQVAQKNVADAGVEERVGISRGDAKLLPYPKHSFDLVISSHAFHHISEPLVFLNEIARVVKPAGAILITDLRRPPKFLISLFVTVFGFGSKPLMRNLYRDSLKAAYTPEELRQLLRESAINNASIRTYFPGYAVIGRPVAEKRQLQDAWKVDPLKTLGSILSAKRRERNRPQSREV